MDPSKRQASVGVFHLERPLKFQFIVFEGSFQVKCSHRNWKGGFPCNITDGPQCIVYTLWEFTMLASCYVKIIQILLLQPRFFSCKPFKKNQIQAVFLEDESRPNICSLGITRKIYQNLEYTSSTYIVCTTNYSIDSATLLLQ